VKRARTRSIAVVAVALAAIAPAAAADPPAASLAARHDEDVVPRGPTVAERLAVNQRLVQAHAAYPPLARRRRAEGTALVAFEVGADGRARRVAVAETSGFALLDRAALRAVHDAGELPYVYGRLEVPVVFELVPRAPGPVAALP
jgi:protein TonB